MNRGRLEAFSDGVLAIVITIMVLEMKVPRGTGWPALGALWPVLLCYVLSFVYIGIYWNNHHHLISAAKQIDGAIMWANLHLLFWLTLVPFVTGWMGENHFAPVPTVLYGFVLLMAAITYWLLQAPILRQYPADSPLRREFKRDWKGWLSPLAYLFAICAAFYWPWIAWGLYALVAVIWVVPDKRIERALAAK